MLASIGGRLISIGFWVVGVGFFFWSSAGFCSCERVAISPLYLLSETRRSSESGESVLCTLMRPPGWIREGLGTFCCVAAVTVETVRKTKRTSKACFIAGPFGLISTLRCLRFGHSAALPPVKHDKNLRAPLSSADSEALNNIWSDLVIKPNRSDR